MKRAIQIWELIPFILTMLVGILCSAIYSATAIEINPLLYFEALGIPLVLLVFVFLNKYQIIKTPIFSHYLIAFHLILAVDFGTVLEFYDKFSFWDMLVHGYFGFVFSLLVYFLFLNFKGDKLNKWFLFALIFFVVLGVSAIWEIYEFTYDSIFNEDAQRVVESMALGLSPVYDTMMDIIIAIAGIGAFYGLLSLDYAFGNRLDQAIRREILIF